MDSFAHLSKGMQQRVVATTDKIMSSGKDPFERDYIADIGTGRPEPCSMFDIASTLTATSCASRRYWSTKRFRRLSIPDMMRLQGADFVTLHGWEEVINDRQRVGDRRA